MRRARDESAMCSLPSQILDYSDLGNYNSFVISGLVQKTCDWWITLLRLANEVIFTIHVGRDGSFLVR